MNDLYFAILKDDWFEKIENINDKAKKIIKDNGLNVVISQQCFYRPENILVDEDEFYDEHYYSYIPNPLKLLEGSKFASMLNELNLGAVPLTICPSDMISWGSISVPEYVYNIDFEKYGIADIPAVRDIVIGILETLDK